MGSCCYLCKECLYAHLWKTEPIPTVLRAYPLKLLCGYFLAACGTQTSYDLLTRQLPHQKGNCGRTGLYLDFHPYVPSTQHISWHTEMLAMFIKYMSPSMQAPFFSLLRIRTANLTCISNKHILQMNSSFFCPFYVLLDSTSLLAFGKPQRLMPTSVLVLAGIPKLIRDLISNTISNYQDNIRITNWHGILIYC